MTPVVPSVPDPISRAKSSVDVVLALASILYALGYASWALYAWKFELGVPPALEAQYLVAGVGPAVILLLLSAILVRLRRLAQTPWASQKKIQNTLEALGALIMAAGGVSLLLGRSTGWSLLLAGAVLLGVGSLFSTSPFLVPGFTWSGSVAAVILGLTTIVLYSTRLFPEVPVELGGPRVQCVTVDLDRRNFAGATLDTLASPRAPADSAFIRSVPLWLLMQGPRYVFARPDSNLKAIRGKAFRIDQTKVSAIFPDTDCERRSPSD